MILIRQRGSKFLAGDGVRKGGDDTLYAVQEGIVQFTTKRKTSFDGTLKHKKVIHVLAH